MNSKCGSKRVSCSMRQVLPQTGNFFAGVYPVVLIKFEQVKAVLDAAVVNRGPAVVFTGGFEPAGFEQAVEVAE